MGINSILSIEFDLDDSLEARKAIRSQDLLTCWTWRPVQDFISSKYYNII
jgi:hypothetical protein